MSSSNTDTSGLAVLVSAVNAHTGSWENVQLVQDVKTFLWANYDPRDSLVYPNVSNWDVLLENAMATDKYSGFSKDEVLSILFGLHHRTRIVDGLWDSMFERGVVLKLLKRLSRVDAVG